MESLFLTRDQALNLWIGSTDSKILDYQRTNPREYQIVLTSTKETNWVQDQATPTTSSTLWRTPHPNNKKDKNTTKSSTDRITTSQPCTSEEKKKKKISAQISPYKKLTQTTGPTLGGQKPKGRKNSTLKPGKRRPQTQGLKR